MKTAQEVKNEYQREYMKARPEKRKLYMQKYWAKKAEQLNDKSTSNK